MTPLDELRRQFIEPTDDVLITLEDDEDWCECHGLGTCDLKPNPNPEDATMPTVAKPTTKKTKISKPAQVRKDEHGRQWECPNCGDWNSGLVLRCHAEGCDTLIKLPEGPDKPAPGIEINEFGVVTAGGLTHSAPFPKSWKVGCTWTLAEVQPGSWVFGYHFYGPDGGEVEPITVHNERWNSHVTVRVAAITEAIGWLGQLREFKYTDKAIAVLHEMLGDAPPTEEQDEYSAAECNRDGTAWTFDEWLERLSGELYRRKEIILDRTAFRDQALDWYHAGDSVNEACDKLSERMSAAFDEFCSSPAAEASEQPTLNTPAITAATVMDVPLQALVPHPDNPRQTLVGIEELAASMQANGQLVEALGRRLPDGSIQLLAGHRRFAAAKHAVIRTLRVRVLPDVDDAQALEILGRDNEERENFNPIERACWYAKMVEASGLSQRQLAERLGTSQGNLSNHIRLLTLPEVWQQRVISGEITPTMARDLVVWVERPQVMDEVEEYFLEGPQDQETWTTEEWGWTIWAAIEKVTRQCEPQAWLAHHSARIKPTQQRCCLTEKQIEKHREELDAIEVSHPVGGKELRAFNVTRFDELNDQAAKPKANKAAAADDAEPTDVSAEQQAKRQQQQAEQLARKYHLYRLDWLRNRCVGYISQGNADNWTLVTLAIWSGQREALQAAAVVSRVNMNESPLAKIAAKKVDTWKTLREMVVAWLEHCTFEGWQQPLSEIDLCGLARHLNIDFERDWECDEAFLELHNKAQLAALLKEWKLKSIDAAGGKRGDIIQEILLLEETLPMPKALKKA